MSRSTAAEIPVSIRRQLQITGALSRDRLLEVHFRYAMELVDHTEGELEPARALAIYSRLHSLGTADAGALHHRVFVALGRRTPPRYQAPKTTAEPPAAETPDSMIVLIRRRLRGRVNRALREWVEYHTGRAETELLWAHVENALQYAELLDPVMNTGDAVALYATDLGVSASRVETIYYLALAHRSALAIGAQDSQPDRPETEAASSPPPASKRSMRIVTGRRAAATRQPG